MLLGIFSWQLKTRGGGSSSRLALCSSLRLLRLGCGEPGMCGRVSRHPKLKPVAYGRDVRKRVAEAARSSRQAKERERKTEELPGEPVGRKRWGAM